MFLDQPTVINYEKMIHMLVGKNRFTTDIREYTIKIKNVCINV